MATRRQVTFLIGANIEQLQKGLRNAERRMQRFARQTEQLGRSLTKNVTAPITALGAVAVREFAQLERQTRSLENALIASGAPVEGLMHRYREFANEIQRTTTTSAGATFALLQQAESMGLTGQAARQAATNAIALEGAFGVSAERALRYAAALEEGNASMLGRYIPALRAIDDETEQAAKAQEILNRAFEVTRRNTQTTSGAMAQMRNAVSDAFAEIGEVIAEILLPFIHRIRELAEQFQTLDKDTQRQIVQFGALAAVVGPLILGFGKLVAIGAKIIGWLRPVIALVSNLGRAVMLLLSPLGLKIAAIAALVLVVKSIYDTFEPLQEFFRKLWERIANFFVTSINYVIERFNRLRRAFRLIMPSIGAVVIETFDKINMETGGKLGEFTDNVEKNFTTALGYVQDFFSNVRTGIGGFVGNLTAGGQAAQTFANELQGIATVSGQLISTGTGSILQIPSPDRKIGAEYKSLMGRVKDTNMAVVEMSNAFQTTATNAIVGFGETLGDLFSGDAGGGDFFKAILLMVVDFTKRFGQLLIGAALAAERFRDLILNPGAAIAAGVALIALSTAVQNHVSGGPAQMATGGVVPGGFPNDTYPALLSSGETVIPAPHPLNSGMFGGGGHMDVTVTGRLIAEGRDLVAVLDEENYVRR